MLDIVERQILFWSFPSFFFISLFFPFALVLKILLFAGFVSFLIFFTLCSMWAKPMHPERHIIIGFLASFFHTFFLFLGGTLGLFFGFFFLKFYPFLSTSLKKILPF